MTQFKIFFLNGQAYGIKKNITVFDLIIYLDYNNLLFVLEYNNLICNEKEWKKIVITNHDKIEIITIVGGG